MQNSNYAYIESELKEMEVTEKFTVGTMINGHIARAWNPETMIDAPDYMYKTSARLCKIFYETLEESRKCSRAEKHEYFVVRFWMTEMEEVIDE